MTFILNFDSKTYFYFNNKIYQTNDKGDFKLTEEIQDYYKTKNISNIKEFLEQHKMIEKDVQVARINKVGRIQMPREVVGHYLRLFYYDMGEEYKVYDI